MNESSPGARTTNLEGEAMNLPVLFPSQQELPGQTLESSRQTVILSRHTPFLTRLFEVLFAGSVLILTAPVMLVVALIVRFGTKGEALFWQMRMGRNQKPYRFVKFRTMYADAKERFPHLYEYRYTDEEIQNFKFKVVDDPRVTPQGRWLRTTTLDELPNFWNVLMGDMAIVGPRPEIPEMLPYYTQEQLLKFAVRPGITGLAQISGRGRLTFQDTTSYDVEYVRNRSAMLDLRIIVLTVFKMITRNGAF
jgi:lipopolysaccharide/colanic/teichoic acid biosynthesis glycosyltransferase